MLILPLLIPYTWISILETILGCIGHEAAFKVCKTLSILSLYRCDLAENASRDGL